MVVLFARAAIHDDTVDAWAASIRPGMGQFVASLTFLDKLILKI
jgi:hypothetical protein